MTTLTFEVNSLDLNRLVDQVQKIDEMILTQNGKPVARLMPIAPITRTTSQPVPLDADLIEQDAAMEQEIAAYEAQHAQLVTRYLDQFIVMYHGQVVDHDSDQGALLARVKQRYAKKIVLLRKVERTLPGPIYMRSFHFESLA